jgi:hypothetical protein
MFVRRDTLVQFHRNALMLIMALSIIITSMLDTIFVIEPKFPQVVNVNCCVRACRWTSVIRCRMIGLEVRKTISAASTIYPVAMDNAENIASF